MEDETLNIKKIIWDIILSWRTIIIFAIIFGLALGCYKYKKEVDAYKLVSSMDANEATDNVIAPTTTRLKIALTLSIRPAP